jgi:hypothetical protein
VTHPNRDGSDRQELIRDCRVFETLELHHEEDNPHDPNAVRVCRANGTQLGYLNAELASEVVTKSKQGYRFVAFVKDITGGGEGQSLGVNLLIIVVEPGIGDREVKKYLNQLIQKDPELKGARIKGGYRGMLIAFILVGIFAAILYYLLGHK